MKTYTIYYLEDPILITTGKSYADIDIMECVDGMYEDMPRIDDMPQAYRMQVRRCRHCNKMLKEHTDTWDLEYVECNLSCNLTLCEAQAGHCDALDDAGNVCNAEISSNDGASFRMHVCHKCWTEGNNEE